MILDTANLDRKRSEKPWKSRWCSRGKTTCATLAEDDGTDAIFELGERWLSVESAGLVLSKILFKGKMLSRGVPLSAPPLNGVAAVKCMIMASSATEVAAVRDARSDPTVRGFASEDALAKHHIDQSLRSEELSKWGVKQDAKHRFCRFEPCTWQSFGTRPSSNTPHAFEARALLLKLAQDPGIIEIMRSREYTVGLLAELDPIDDRHAEKMEGEGRRLLGYNTNAGAEVHIRLRTEDLTGFLSYPALIDTLLHELAHNEVGPHNEDFWHLFCRLKADYLRTLIRLSAAGQLFDGKSALGMAEANAEAADVRAAVLLALSRDRQVPASQLQIRMLDEYLGASGGPQGAAAGGHTLRGADSARAIDAREGASSAAEMRELLAERAGARMSAKYGSVAEHRGPPADAKSSVSASASGQSSACGSDEQRSQMDNDKRN